ncbi:MAG: L,D-transpeptidase [Pseudomonadota bacterium]
MSNRKDGRRPITRRHALGYAAAMPAASLWGAAALADMAIDLEAMRPGDYTWHPERSPSGAVSVIVSLPEQRVHVYRNGIRIAVSTCSTGKAGHETPTGVFTILQKDRDHHSSTYNDAPMPNMNRLTWDGVALHAGNLPGYPASHGCVRLPLAFSKKLFTVTHVGTPVIIAGARTDPWELNHPGLVLNPEAGGALAGAVAALDARSHPSDWGRTESYPITTVLATGADRRLVLLEDGRKIMDGPLTILGNPRLGEHVLVLNKGRDNALVWLGLTHHPDPSQPLAPEGNIVGRLRGNDAFVHEMARRMHPGMTFVVSDLAATPDRRSGRDMVIMAGGGMDHSPRPAHRPG